MKMLLFGLIFSSFTVHAEVGREEVSVMIQQMVRENVISREEAEKAVARVEVNQKALKGSRGPASVTVAESKIESVSAVDLEKEQLVTIQNDLKKISPHHQGQ